MAGQPENQGVSLINDSRTDDHRQFKLLVQYAALTILAGSTGKFQGIDLIDVFLMISHWKEKNWHAGRGSLLQQGAHRISPRLPASQGIHVDLITDFGTAGHWKSEFVCWKGSQLQ